MPTPLSTKLSSIRWCGVDFGETMMNPFTLHQSVIIREIYNELGKGPESEGRVKRWYELRDSFSSLGDSPHLRARSVKEYARDRIYQDVLGNEPEAIRLFEEKEVRGFSPAPGLEAAFRSMERRGIQLSVVSEVTQIPAMLVIRRFLKAHNLAGYIQSLVTPAGLFTADGRLLDDSFAGATKKSGAIYEKLSLYLNKRGIQGSEAMIIGDDPLRDIENAKVRGFVTVQYVGIIDRGRSARADYVVSDWSEISRSA